MKVSKETRDRIADIKADVSKQKNDLVRYMAMLDEHPGTKRIRKQLEQIIFRIDDWQRS